MNAPMLHVRVREAHPGESLEDIQSHDVVEVLNHAGVCLGWLPATTSAYSTNHPGHGEITLTLVGGGADYGSVHG